MSTALSILKAFSSLLEDKFNILSLKYDKYSQKFIFMTDIQIYRQKEMTSLCTNCINEKLCGKPVKYVINTHYHFDHTANDAYFDAAFMTPASVDYATIPYKGFSGISFPRNYPVVTVQDGYPLNLGSRALTIIEFPHANHTIGGIAILTPPGASSSQATNFCSRIKLTSSSHAGTLPTT